MPYWNITDLSYTDSGCNNISLAILRQSEVDLRQALAVSLSSINQTNNMGQSALHLAVEWPRGMDLLLQAGADVDCKDGQNRSPLSYAIDMSLVEHTVLLGLADCSLLDESGQLFLVRAVHLECSAHLNRRQVTAAEMVVNLLVDMVIDRRQRLYDLAKSALPVSELGRLCHDSYLIDESASRLYLALLRQGTAVPLAFDPGKDRGTLFHQIGNSSRVAERLWKAGFRNIDGRDSWGLTPLMCLSDFFQLKPSYFQLDFELDYVAWLLGKGADFYAKQDLTAYYEHPEAESFSVPWQPFIATAWHYVADHVGLFLALIHAHDPEVCLEKILSGASKKMLQRIFIDNDSDACMCACSISGCNAFTKNTKSYISFIQGRKEHSQDLVDLWANLCNPLKISEFLRIMTFEGLRLTHTCCYKTLHCESPNGQWIIKDAAEIDEIHDEEAEDLQKLEELLEEFEAKRKELDIPFEDFIDEYWRPRMDEVLEEGTLDEDALREIGVKVF